MRVSVLGAGSWALGLAILLNHNGHQVTVWSKVPAEIEAIQSTGENARALPGVMIPKTIQLTTDLKKALTAGEFSVVAVASPYVRSTAKEIAACGIPHLKLVDVAKGIEEDSLMTMTSVIKDEVKDAEVAILSGPSHAEEVSRLIPTSCVIGAETKEYAQMLQNVFMSEIFRVYISPDILGIELGGSLKNVIALAAGIADGLGYGDNSKAALITRGMHEIGRLGVAMGGKLQTFYGLSGMGDLIVTCASMHSRNRRAGILMGQGKSMQEAMDEVHQVVEGVYSAKAALALSRQYNIEMPIVESVNKVLFEGKNPAEAVKDLMLRDKKIENSDIPWE